MTMSDFGSEFDETMRGSLAVWVGAALLAALCGCASGSSNTTSSDVPSPSGPSTFKGLRAQTASDLIAGRPVAIAYSGFRRGQHPDRGDGAVLPSRAEILEDLRILLRDGFDMIRLYDARENSRDVLAVIEREALPMKVLLGAWLNAELSSHETCEWLDAPTPPATLAANQKENEREVARVIELAGRYEDIVVAVNVGNETLVTWNDHLLPIESMVRYLSEVRRGITQPVTTADNYLAWVEHAEALAAHVDFAFVHSYPVWEGKSVDEALDFTVENLRQVQDAMGDIPIAIGEAGWATVAVEFRAQAGEWQQERYVGELVQLAHRMNVTTFVFEAFDEPWKGHLANPDGAEKHWGLYTVDRTPKAFVENGGLRKWASSSLIEDDE
ncbi:MAG: glycosyl hydrolase family 17 protein [Myxococcota bacterium]